MRAFTIFAVLIVAVICLTEAQSERHCGSDLLHAMEFLCRGKFQGMTGPARKRASSIGAADVHLDYPQEEVRFGDGHEHLSRFRRSVYSFQPVMWYIERGIIDKCCDNPCTVDTMLSYCKEA